MFPKQIQDRFDKGMGCWSNIDEGWIPLIIELDQKLSVIDPDYTIDQIKEKFGGLRFYFSSEKEGLDVIVDEYEHKSYSICEMCGSTMASKRSIKGWLKTLCSEHYKETLDKVNK